jgi:hypothetical protein
VAGAAVRATNTERSFVYQGETTPNGDYYIPYLTSGTYRLEVEADGFKKSVQEGIVLRTNETPRFNIQLELGSITESITVDATPPLLETETAGSGQVLDGDLVVKIPVMQKFVHRVLLYMPGVNTINGNTALGQRQRSIGYTIDGVSGKEPVVGQVNDFNRSMIVSLDSIQEFKMWTTGLPAEVGHSGGGLLSAVFRSGTNDFHGSIEDRYTNGVLIHRQYFEQLRRDGKFIYREWGATGGGPIVKDKTFFFAGFQQHYERLSETFSGNVPSPQMYQGNFDFGPNSFPIYDPATTEQDGNGNWSRQQFTNNQIPQGRFDPVANKLIALKPWREQTTAGTITPQGPTQNLVYTPGGGFNFQRYDGKVDHQFSSMHKIFGRYSQVRHRNESRPQREITEVRFQDVIVEPADFRNVVISDTYTISPTMINESRISYNRRHFTREPETLNQDWAGQLGIPGVSEETFPDFRQNNPAGDKLYNLGPGGRAEQVAEDFTLQNNLTKIAGKHTLKTGYELIRTRYNSVGQALPSGQYRMGGTEFPFRANTGHPFASLLLGTVSRADFTQNVASWLPRWWQHGLYLQDSWKARPDLTLELGLRWSYESPFETKYGQQSQFDPTVTDPVSGLQGAIVHSPGQLAKRDFNNFQPRLGLSWNFRPQLAFRSSFGLMTIDAMTNASGQNFEEYFATASVQSPPGDPRTPFALSQGPGPVPFNIRPDGSVPFSGQNFSGRIASFYDPNFRMPYIMSWSGGLQYQMTTTWLVEGMYQGSAGIGLLNNWDMNAIPLNISSDPVELDQIFRASQNFKPWRQFGQIQHYGNYGHSTYHGGTLRFEKRYSGGMGLNAFYTFSKSINEADNDGSANGITFYNRALEKGRASYDIAHRLVGVLTAELPFGTGRRYMNTGRVKNALLGGWDFAWTQTIQSGPPVTIGSSGSPFNYLPGNLRPVQILPRDQAQVQDWDIGPERFVAAVQNRYFTATKNAGGTIVDFPGFAYPAAFTAGNVGRNTFEAPGLFWTQLSLSKEFRITERFRFSIRWDVNNATKEPQFANPNTTFNTRNTASFGTFNASRGSFSDVGTARLHHIIVSRFTW